MRGASVVVTATSATEPVLRGAWLQPGAHVNAVGACVAGWRELDDDVMRNVVYVDSRAAAAVESGDVILSKCAVHAELGELFSGAVPSRADETTVFKSLGLAVEDVAAASLVWRRLSRRAESECPSADDGLADRGLDRAAHHRRAARNESRTRWKAFRRGNRKTVNPRRSRVRISAISSRAPSSTSVASA